MGRLSGFPLFFFGFHRRIDTTGEIKNPLFAMKIALGSDHAGFAYKQSVKKLLLALGHEVKDCGTDSEKPVGYPEYIRPAAQAVASGECERGIVFGGSGNGEAMVANKVKGVRCAYVWNSQTAELGRRHNDANVMAIGQRMISEYIMLECVGIFLETAFEGGRHIQRIAEIE
jgi:ribose 5-phosphate isomerase B